MFRAERLTEFLASFRFKLFLIFTLVTAVTVTLFSALHVYSEIKEKRANTAEVVRLLAQRLAMSARLPLYAENRQTLLELAREEFMIPEIHAVLISAHDGRVLVHLRRPVRLDPSEIIVQTVEVRSGPEGLSAESAFTGGRGSSEALIGTVRIERGTADLTRKSIGFIRAIAAIALLFWLMVSGFSYLALRRLTHSYNGLIQGIGKMRGGDYSVRLDAQSDDEPGRAGRAINELAAALLSRDRENLRLQQELSEAVRHESAANESLVSLNGALEEEINERIRFEQNLRESKQTLKELMHMMPVAVGWVDKENQGEYLNQTFVDWFGYTLEDIPTLDSWYNKAIPDPAARESFLKTLAERLRKSRDEKMPMQPLEMEVTCKNNEVRRVIMNTQVTRDRRLAVYLDITERELLQDQLIKAQKLESLGVLAGGIAHNFNNVLTGILGYISYARLFTDGTNKASMALEKAEMASRRAAGMANQLLTFARGGMPVKKPIALQKLVEECVSLALVGTNVQAVVDIPARVHSVKADEGQLSQAFNNILINAVQAMPEGGKLDISARNVTLGEANRHGLHPGQYVMVSFTDHGCGIPENDLQKIFDPYFTTKPHGTGLGLCSVHSIILKHGGHVAVQSQLKQGTTFSIHLPSLGEALPEKRQQRRRHDSDTRMDGELLVMDDEETIRAFARDTLGFLGFQVTTCKDGSAAIEIYQAALECGRPFFAVILDLTVPGGMGGLEAARRILAIDPAARLIVSSGYAYDPVMAGFRNYGFCTAVQKPYSADELARELSALQSQG
jgi:signal transduction histidine kinase/CheY-like chemotaxis protein